MYVQLSSIEGLPETVKARKRSFMTEVAIISHFEISFILFACPIMPEIKFYDHFRAIDLSTGHVLVKKNCFN